MIKKKKSDHAEHPNHPTPLPNAWNWLTSTIWFRPLQPLYQPTQIDGEVQIRLAYDVFGAMFNYNRIWLQ